MTAPVWGFELAHNDGPHEALDAHMLAALQAGFADAARANAGNAWPCGLEAATRDGEYNISATRADAAAKRLTLAQQPPVRFARAPLPPSTGRVQCDPSKLDERIDWSLLRHATLIRAAPRRRIGRRSSMLGCVCSI